MYAAIAPGYLKIVNIGAVNRQAGRHFHQRVGQFGQADIARLAVARGKLSRGSCTR